MNTDQKQPDNAYTCPMHPDVTGNKGDKCPKCGMTLIPSVKDNNDLPEVKLSSGSLNIEANKPTNLCIAITEHGKNVSLEVVHEMKMHLMIVNEELSWFNHIHPEEQADGMYHVSETFPAAGKYLLYTDYKPSGGTQEVNRHTIEVSGALTFRQQPLETKLVSTVNDYTISFLNGNDLKTNSVQELQFSVVKNGQALQEKDMQLYLGATSHIVMINKADYDFLHIHPASDSRFPIYAETNIKKTGLYRMWVQFKINDIVHTADFTVTVSRGGEKSEMHHNTAHH